MPSSPPSRSSKTPHCARTRSSSAATHLTCAIGIASSKVVAKVASDRRKPAGLTAVRPGTDAAFLAPFPIRLLPGVGPRAEERLKAAGIETIGQIAAVTDEQLGSVL